MGARGGVKCFGLGRRWPEAKASGGRAGVREQLTCGREGAAESLRFIGGQEPAFYRRPRGAEGWGGWVWCGLKCVFIKFARMKVHWGGKLQKKYALRRVL